MFYPTSASASGKQAAGKFPVLLTQTPYGKGTLGSLPGASGSQTGANDYLVQRGYIDVVADVRGTGSSEGTFGLFDPAQITDGVTLVKFWMHISDEEQLRRFNDRASTPSKQWKLTEQDWRNRSLRPSYLRALKDMIDWTDRSHAHWDLVAAEDKRFARVYVLETLIKRWEHDLERRGFEVPPSHGTNYLA